MSENKHGSAPWVDPDDAPDLSQADVTQAVWHVAGREVPSAEGIAAMQTATRRGRPKGTQRKEPVTLRLDPEVLARWRASGKGWQTRMAQAMAEKAP